MTKSKSYNRIVFMTTLSLYLGLVLVSGCNSSHSALTKSFDLKNEVEFKDDLDKNPDQDIPTLFAELLDSIENNAESGRINLPIQKEFLVDGSFTRSLNGGGGGFGHNIADQNLSLIVQDSINRKLKPKVLESIDFKGETKTARIIFSADGANFNLKVSFNRDQPAQFAEFLKQKFSASVNAVSDQKLKQIYENTKVSSENDQVFIVTRLPRAALDDPLAKSYAN